MHLRLFPWICFVGSAGRAPGEVVAVVAPPSPLPKLRSSCSPQGARSSYLATWGGEREGQVVRGHRMLQARAMKKLRGRELNPGLPRDRRKY